MVVGKLGDGTAPYAARAPSANLPLDERACQLRRDDGMVDMALSNSAAFGRAGSTPAPGTRTLAPAVAARDGGLNAGSAIRRAER